MLQMTKKLEELVDALIGLVHEAETYLKRQNGAPMQLPLPVGHNDDAERAAAFAAGPKLKTTKKQAEKKPEPEPDILADIEGKKPEPVVYEKIAERKKITPEESLPLALTTAKDFVQRFQKASPDGLARLRKILAEVYKVEKIGQMKHEARVEFIAKLENEMAEAVA